MTYHNWAPVGWQTRRSCRSRIHELVTRWTRKAIDCRNSVAREREHRKRRHDKMRRERNRLELRRCWAWLLWLLLDPNRLEWLSNFCFQVRTGMTFDRHLFVSRLGIAWQANTYVDKFVVRNTCLVKGNKTMPSWSSRVVNECLL